LEKLPWSIMDSPHEKGYISDPADKNKSLWLFEKGAKLSEKLVEKPFLPLSSGSSTKVTGPGATRNHRDRRRLSSTLPITPFFLANF
jgi:Domain of unknown function (DUF6429)